MNELIPEGHYCYTPVGFDDGIYKVKPCPYMSCDRTGIVSYCSLINMYSIPANITIEEYKILEETYLPYEIENMMNGSFLLWDSVKE